MRTKGDGTSSRLRDKVKEAIFHYSSRVPNCLHFWDFFGPAVGDWGQGFEPGAVCTYLF